jgi:hypothetical protein
MRSKAAMKMYYATLSQGSLASKIYTAAVSLMSAGNALLHGNIKRATAALRTFNTVVKLNLAGLLSLPLPLW